jgi:hypothetical protein
VRAKRRVLYLLLAIACLFVNGKGEAANWEVHGRIVPVIYYTPEEWLLAGQDVVLGISTWANIGNSRLSISMNGLDVRWKSTPFANSLPSFNTGIWDLTLTMTGKLTEKTKPVTMGIGILSLNYSPYTIRTGTTGNPYKRGISLSGLNWGKQNRLDAFALWDGSQTKMAYGTKAQLKWRTGTLTPILVVYQEGGLTDSEGVKTFQLSKVEKVSELDLTQSVGPVKLNVIAAQQEKTGAEPASIFDLKTSYQINNYVGISGGYRKYDLSYDPRYRDRTPRLDSKTNTLLSWNPIDRYKGKAGGYFELSGNEKSSFLKLTCDRYEQEVAEGSDTISKAYLVARESGSKYTTNFEFGYAQKLSRNLTAVREATTEGLLLSGRLGRKLGNNLLEVELTMIKDDSFTAQEFYHEYLVNYRGLKGAVNYDLGVRKRPEQRPFPYLRASMRTPIGLNLTVWYSPHNFVEPKPDQLDLWYDIFERQRLVYDNMFKAEAAVYF